MKFIRPNRSVLGMLVLSALLAFMGCQKADKYDIQTYFGEEEAKRLTLDIITYVLPPPPSVAPEQRFLPLHRGFYMSQLPQFHMDFFYVAQDGTHYFYMRRPARHPKFTQRGVGGKFRLNAVGQVVQFREVFNTPVMKQEDLTGYGKMLFQEMLKSGNVDIFLDNQTVIEWPNEVSRYDTLTHQWVGNF